MTREEMILKIKKFFNSKKEAEEFANDYTDEEIRKFGREIVDDLEEDFRFCTNYDHLIEQGYY